eukprot:NODE_140_length_16098_cov_0.678605.p4 type:complete len:354 gc:universal NODE_140_length_16098_cov_0.678605:8989-10050(+)
MNSEIPNIDQLWKETRMLFDSDLPSKPYKFNQKISPSRNFPSDAIDPMEIDNTFDSKLIRLQKVIVGHDGWVRSVCFDPFRKFFVSGSVDKLVKIWDVQGHLKLTLTGHLASIRDLKMSKQHPYLYSASEDKTVRCWDLTTNRAIRKYHGHLHGIYCMALDETGEWFVSGGRDAVCRIFDCRTRKQELVLTGHEKTVSSVLIKDNYIITGGMDSTIRIYDKRNGDMVKGLTTHSKGVRSMCHHPTLNCFFSASADSIKSWKYSDFSLFCDFEDFDKSIVNSLCCNENYLVAGNDAGKLQIFDTKIMKKCQEIQSLPQPGSLESESSILACQFDHEKLYTGEMDKTIKIWDFVK